MEVSGQFNKDSIYENGFCDNCPFKIEELSPFYEHSDYYQLYKHDKCLNNEICSRIYLMIKEYSFMANFLGSWINKEQIYIFMKNMYKVMLMKLYLDRYSCYGCVYFQHADQFRGHGGKRYCELKNCVNYFKTYNKNRKCPYFSDDIKFRYEIIRNYLNCCIKTNKKEK